MSTYVGTDANNDVNTGLTNQHAVGLEGNDRLHDGYAGLDHLHETLEGNEGNDYLFFEGPAGGFLYGGSGNDALLGLDGVDHAYGGDGDDYVDGNAVNFTHVDDDIIEGGDGVDGLYGRGGNDKIYGGEGNENGDATLLAATNTTVTDNLLDSDSHTGLTYKAGLYGGDGDDYLDGGSGADDLAGGAGKDLLVGGEGVDYFFFDTALNRTTNVDRIQDFEHHTDLIKLAASVFSDLGTSLSSGEFALGNRALDGNDRILYQERSGKIFYDHDGAGGDGKVLFAIVDKHTVLDVHDFDVF